MTTKLKMWLSTCVVLLGVFALGSVAGAGLDGLYRSKATAAVTPAPSMRDGEAYLPVLDRQLRLTEEQAAGIRVVLGQTRDRYSALCAEVRPKYNVVRDEARQRLRAMLRPDQQQLFDSIISQENCNCPVQAK